MREYGEGSELGPGIGLKFIELSPGASQRIEKFLAHEQALFFDED